MIKAYLWGLLTVLFWSTSPTAFKITLKSIDVFQMLFYSIGTATILLGVFLWMRGKTTELFSLNRKDVHFYLLLGILNPLIHYLMAFKAYDLLPAQIAQPLNYTWVITLALVSVPLLKQPLGRIDIFATLICYAGVVVVSYRHGEMAELNPWGIFLAISCTLIWSLYWIYNIRSRRDPVIAIFLNFLFATPFALAACLLFSSPRLPDLHGLLGAVWVGCFEFCFAFLSWITALRLSRNTHKITNMIFLTPFISLLFIHYMLGEQILFQTFVGLVLIVSGLIVQKYGQYFREKDKEVMGSDLD